MRITAPSFRLRTAYHVAFSPDSRLVAAVGRDVVWWSVPERRRLGSSRVPSNPSAAAFTSDGRTLVVKNTTGEFLTCDTATGDTLARYAPRGRDEGADPVIAPDGWIVDGSWNGVIRRRDVASLTPTEVWRDDRTMVIGVLCGGNTWAFVLRTRVGTSQPDGSPLNGRILLSRAPLQGQFDEMERRWAHLRSAALSPLGDRLAVRSGATDPVVEIVDVRSGASLASSTSSFGGTGFDLAWSPDGQYMVLIEDRAFSIRETDTLREIRLVNSEHPASAAFSPDGRLLALGSWSDGIVTSLASVLASPDARG